MNCLYCSKKLTPNSYYSEYWYCHGKEFIDYDILPHQFFDFTAVDHAIVGFHNGNLKYCDLIFPYNNQNIGVYWSSQTNILDIFEFKRYVNIPLLKIPNTSLSSFQEIPAMCQRYLDLKAFS